MIHSCRILPTRPTIKIKHKNGKKKGGFSRYSWYFRVCYFLENAGIAKYFGEANHVLWLCKYPGFIAYKC